MASSNSLVQIRSASSCLALGAQRGFYEVLGENKEILESQALGISSGISSGISWANLECVLKVMVGRGEISSNIVKLCVHIR